jgi:glycerol uptake facilitator-like aquaporin
MVGYVVAQIGGAVVAMRALMFAMPTESVVDARFGIPAVHQTITFWQAFTIEAVLTFALMFAVYGTAMHKKAVAMGGWFVGMVVFMGILASGPLTGGCFNPARYFGPAIASATFTDAVLYSTGPILGAALAALIYHYWLTGKDEPAAA